MKTEGDIVAIVPARGGSKSVPRKNLQLLGDKPLLAWPIKTALATAEIDRVLVSTEDAEIADCARAFGAEAIDRPPALATDTAQVMDAVRHVLGVLEAEERPARIVVLLEATSPFRTAELVSTCLHRLEEENLDAIATFNEALVNPERTWRIDEGAPRPFIAEADPWLPRQKLTPAYQLNGAVYAFRVDRLPPRGENLLFGRAGAVIMARDMAIDIDDNVDLKRANALLST